MAVASLQVTKTYADGASWTEAKMDAAMQSIQTYTQTSVVNNLNQLRRDIWGATYSLDNDGNPNLTNTFYKDCFGKSWTADAPKTNSLYNKQSASVSWNTAISLGIAQVSWTHVSASTNLKFTPEATGKYLITYSFAVRHTNSAAGNADGKYAIFNKTAAATLIGLQIRNDPGAVGGETRITPVHLSYIHNFSSTAVATFALFYRLDASVTLTSHTIIATASLKNSIYGQIHKI